jgi:6-pyruvoyltetrahydropterin/6-carboxytetrahydropterin synthase
MSKNFTISRQIAIDAGYRIMTHGSKCRHIHGHRYTVEAVCEAKGSLHRTGEQTDMVLDFGFIKEEMLTHIDAPCDHGMIVSADDTEVLELFSPECPAARWVAAMANESRRHGQVRTTQTHLGQKLYIVPFQPTAEQLARHWFGLLEQAVVDLSDGVAQLVELIVWETPNCRASFRR